MFVYGFLLVGLVSGYAISSIVFSIVLAARFFAKRSMTFKIVAALLWFLPLFGTIIVGMIINIPYQVYNVVKIFTDK